MNREAVGNLQGGLTLGDMQKFNGIKGIHKQKFAAVLREVSAYCPDKKMGCYSLQDVSDTGKLGRLFRYLQKRQNLYQVLQPILGEHE